MSITALDWNLKPQYLHNILFSIKYLRSGCLSSTIEIAWETEMSSVCSSLTFPVCRHQVIRFKIKIIRIAFMIEKYHVICCKVKRSYLFQNFLKDVSNFNDHLLWNLLTINVKKHITGKTKMQLLYKTLLVELQKTQIFYRFKHNSKSYM